MGVDLHVSLWSLLESLKVKWVNERDEQFLPYDLTVEEPDRNGAPGGGTQQSGKFQMFLTRFYVVYLRKHDKAGQTSRVSGQNYGESHRPHEESLVRWFGNGRSAVRPSGAVPGPWGRGRRLWSGRRTLR